MRLYEIGTQYRQLQEILESDCEFNTDTGEVIDNTDTIRELFLELDKHFGNKLEACAYILSEMDSNASALKEEAKRLNNRAKTLESNGDKLRSLILDTLQHVDGHKIVSQKFTFSTRKSESVYTENEFDLQGDYVRVTEKREPDKKAIREAIQSGIEVKGAKIVNNLSLNIK